MVHWFHEVCVSVADGQTGPTAPHIPAEDAHQDCEGKPSAFTAHLSSPFQKSCTESAPVRLNWVYLRGEGMRPVQPQWGGLETQIVRRRNCSGELLSNVCSWLCLSLLISMFMSKQKGMNPTTTPWSWCMCGRGGSNERIHGPLGEEGGPGLKQPKNYKTFWCLHLFNLYLYIINSHHKFSCDTEHSRNMFKDHIDLEHIDSKCKIRTHRIRTYRALHHIEMSNKSLNRTYSLNI